MVTRLRACHSLTFASRVTSCRQNQTGLAKYWEQLRIWEQKSKKLTSETMRKSSDSCSGRTSIISGGTLLNHPWGKAPAAPAALLQRVLSLTLCIIQSFLRSVSIYTQATTLMKQLFLWFHQSPRDPTRLVLSLSGRLLLLLSPVPLTSPDDVGLILIWNWSEHAASIWSQQQLAVYLKEFCLSNTLYSVHPSSVNQRLFRVTEVTGIYPSGPRREYALDRSPVCT